MSFTRQITNFISFIIILPLYLIGMEEPTKPREPYVEFMEIETKRPYSEIEKFFNANPDILEALEMPYILESLERLPSLPPELNRTIIQYIIAAKKHEVLLGKELLKVLEESIYTGLKEDKDKIWELLNEPHINVNVQEDGDTSLGIAIYGAGFRKEQRDFYLKIIKALLQKGANLDIKNRNGNTPLIEAAKYTDTEIIKLLIDAGANTNNINIQNNNGDTALMYASHNNNPEIVKMLLDNDANPNIQDQDGNTALIWAAKHTYIDIVFVKGGNPDIQKEKTAFNLAAIRNNTKIVQMLLDKGANPDIQNIKGKTALIKAAKYNNIEIVQILLDKDANPNIQNNEGDTALIWAVRNHNPEIVQILLGEGANLDIQNRDGRTALIEAVQSYSKFFEIVQAPLDKGANPNLLYLEMIEALLQKRAKGDLIDAATYKDAEIIKLLLAADANPNIQAKNGDTALIIAVRYRNTEIVQLLLDKDANPNIQDGDGQTALDLAIKDKNQAIIKLIRKAKKRANGTSANIGTSGSKSHIKKIQKDRLNASLLRAARKNNEKEVKRLLKEPYIDIDIKDEEGFTALIWAIVNKNSKMVKMLLDKGANLNIQDDDRWTALQWAVMEKDSDIVKMLLDKGANPDTQNGPITLILAVLYRDPKIVKILLDKCANPNLQNKDGQTALQWAVMEKDSEIVKILLDEGSNPNIQDNDGQTALDLAIKLKYQAIIDLIIKAQKRMDSTSGSTMEQPSKKSHSCIMQ